MAKIVVPVPQMRKIYEEFHLNAAKSLIITTGLILNIELKNDAV